MGKSFIFIIALFAAIAATAQHVNGIFVSKEDFLAKILTDVHSTDSLNRAFVNLKGDLVLLRDGKRKVVTPSEVFGFQSGDVVYRSFIDKKKLFSLTGYYKIEQHGDVVIYSQRGQYKTNSTVFHYVSNTLESPIKRLSKRYLRSIAYDHTCN